ncbi:benzoate/H(+) symporter BenE family transporter [Aneurinibacillus sp. Ricciae_BoGa-3]|uniref:benzoate/H(+) symporter BenE family transporter n=1 Tax=Aneurinibacillus sp. Ricciae_BoGa-3 TaxID=3022697 RepID=UPI0023423559|nr:benzoate/H(+) symporter BenE family transporter [Aneurinibacillus sp. Ricciae_BoGa-3]WCK56504.1 benzoate/H(+) symporter BenE family transporter [Aneurinibacillus sp. Ricciae_BoGa-3]
MKRNLVEFPQHLTVGNISNGLVSWIFGATGPLLIVLQAASKGNLSADTVSSWIFGIYGVGGLLTLLLSFYYRQPIGYAFSIPGAILVGASLSHHSFSQVIGAYLVVGVVTLILGMSGAIHKMMKVLPMPVMMGMVSGVLLPFGTDIFHSIVSAPILNGIPLVVFFVLSCFRGLAKRFPPILGAIVAGIIMLYVVPGMHAQGVDLSVVKPHLYMPSFDLATMGELVLPLVLTIIAIQNAQGIAVLQSAGYKAPVNSMTSWSGVGSIVNGFFGAHSACIAGPMTAILSTDHSLHMDCRYAAAVVLGILSCVLALFAPFAASIPHLVPSSLIKLLGGLAMVGVLIDSLQRSFSEQYKMGALFSFMITISGISVFHIGAPFWGLVGGTLVSLFLERKGTGQRTQAAGNGQAA